MCAVDWALARKEQNIPAPKSERIVNDFFIVNWV